MMNVGLNYFSKPIKGYGIIQIVMGFKTAYPIPQFCGFNICYSALGNNITVCLLIKMPHSGCSIGGRLFVQGTLYMTASDYCINHRQSYRLPFPEQSLHLCAYHQLKVHGLIFYPLIVKTEDSVSRQCLYRLKLQERFLHRQKT